MVVQTAKDEPPNVIDEVPVAFGAELSNLVPGRPSIATQLRWADPKHGRTGLDGKRHVLESYKSTRQRFTSLPAVRRFLTAINRPANWSAQPSPTSRQRQKQAAAAALAEIL